MRDVVKALKIERKMLVGQLAKVDKAMASLSGGVTRRGGGRKKAAKGKPERKPGRKPKVEAEDEPKAKGRVTRLKTKEQARKERLARFAAEDLEEAE